MKNYIIILLSVSMFLFTVCKKEKHTEEDLYGTWEADLGDDCNAISYALKKIQIEFAKNSIGHVNYYYKQFGGDSLCWPTPCQISWSLKKEKKDYYLLLQYPDSCSCRCSYQVIVLAKYSIDLWTEDRLYLTSKSYSGYTTGGEIFCSLSIGGLTNQVHLTKIK